MKWVEIFIFWFIIVIINAYYIDDEIHDNNNDDNRSKRQVSLDDLIHGALQLVKPIFDTSEPLRDADSPMIPVKKVVDDSQIFEGHQQAVLGVEQDNSFKDAPICRGNSRICKFIACSAHNFKHDQNFANLNLAAQLISDKNLRKTITNNPESVVSVCKEQGLSESQCKLFSQGFQVIDKFITVVEPKDAVKDEFNPVTPKEKPVISEPIMDAPKMSKPIRNLNRNSMNSPALGSRTWSTHHNSVLSESGNVVKPIVPEVVINHKTTDERKLYTNPPLSTKPIHIPTAKSPSKNAPKHVSTVNTPIQPVIKRPIAKAPTKHDGISFSVDDSNLVISRPRRSFPTFENDFEDIDTVDGFVRQKRSPDYYEQVESSGQTPTRSTDSDYYGSVVENVESSKSSSTSSNNNGFVPMNCFAHLG